MEIRAAVARSPHSPMSIERLHIEAPRDNEILVRIEAVGVCHTDIVVRDQHIPSPQPIVLGHEGAGIVESVGASITKVSPGDHVVLTFDSCGTCSHCHKGEPTYCDEGHVRSFGGSRMDGSCALSNDDELIHSHFFGQSSFASHSLAYERNAIKVPEDVPMKMLGPLGCGIQTGAGAVINALQLGFGDTIAVFGAGSVGMSAIMAANAVGASTIVAVDKNRQRLEMSLDFGATHAVDVGVSNAVEQIRKITGKGVNFSIEATGIPALVPRAIECLDALGLCGLIGSFPGGSTAPLDLLFMLAGGRGVRGIVEGDAKPDVFIPQLIDLNKQGRFPFDRLITYYPFEHINQAIADCESGEVIKPVLCMGEHA